MVDWDVCVDDSGISRPSRYLVLGGVMITTDRARQLRDSITAWRTRENLLDEIAWTKVTRGKLRRYKTFVKGSMHYVNHSDVSFGCARFDREDNRYFPNVRNAVARDKMAYQFLLHCFLLKVAQSDRMFIYPDEDLVRGSVDDLRRILNAGLAKHTGWRGVNIVRAIKPRHSHACHFIQMADLLTGAVACANNRCHDVNSSRGAAKQNLVDYIEGLVGSPLTQGMNCNDNKFNIWFFEPQKKMASVSPTTVTEPRVQTDHSTPG